MTLKDFLFLTGFFLVIFFFVGSKHKPTTLSGWLAFGFLSFTLTPLISIPLTWYVCRMMVHNSEHPHPVFPPQLASFEL